MLPSTAFAQTPASPAPVADAMLAGTLNLTVPPSFSSSSLPDAPLPHSNAQDAPDNGKQTSRILGIIPNFRSIGADQHLPPQTVRDKFVTASQDSFDYSAVFLPAVVSAANYARNSTPEFGTGTKAYGRYFWHTALDQTVENMMVEFVVPAVTHEDTRFYTLGHGGPAHRAGYALSRIVVTRTDSGARTFNIGEVAGAGLAAGISNLYYPAAERTASNTLSQWGLNLGIDAATFAFKEFWPDINHALFHGKSER